MTEARPSTGAVAGGGGIREAPWAEYPDRPREVLVGEKFRLAELAVWEERSFETGLQPARA